MANTSPPKSYEDFSVELNAIQKSFPGVRANSDGNLKILRGTIHALLGENGAGKSTLMNDLLSKDRAIVTDKPGTTRDYLEEHPEDAKTIVQKVILAAQARHAAQKALSLIHISEPTRPY